MNNETNISRSSIVEAMAADHRQLEVCFERVMASLRGADVEQIRERWLALDRALERHLSAEEELFLPRLTQTLPLALERVRREHRELRQALVQLGVDLDLHELAPASAACFIEAVRKHAAYEEAQLYPWVERHLDDAAKLSLLSRLRSHVHLARRHGRSPDVDEQELA